MTTYGDFVGVGPFLSWAEYDRASESMSPGETGLASQLFDPLRIWNFAGLKVRERGSCNFGLEWVVGQHGLYLGEPAGHWAHWASKQEVADLVDAWAASPGSVAEAIGRGVGALLDGPVGFANRFGTCVGRRVCDPALRILDVRFWCGSCVRDAASKVAVESGESVGFVYLARRGNGLFKIGFSSNVAQRERELRSFAPDLVMVGSSRSRDAFAEERRLHARFAGQRISPSSEYFALREDQVGELLEEWGE